MLVKSFDIDEVLSHIGFYILENVGLHADNVYLYFNKPSGLVAFEDYNIYRLDDGHVLIAFSRTFPAYWNDYNLVANDGVTTEIVSTQFYERIYKYYNQSVSSSNGVFFIVGSEPAIGEGAEWRCDLSKYGFASLGAEANAGAAQPSSQSDIIVYEPILSVNSVAYIVYAQMTYTDTAGAFDFINESVMQTSARTLLECLKLVTEWAACTEEPWNNTQEIAVRSKELLARLNFGEDLISHISDTQVDMQVFNYLKGNTDARQRPSSPVELTEPVDTFIKKKVSHRCLSHVLSLYPNSTTELETIRAIEIEQAAQAQINLLQRTNLETDSFTSEDIPAITASMKKKNKDVEIAIGTLIDLTVAANYREILDNAIN